MEGKVYLDAPALGQVNATNLTAGLGGVSNHYNEPVWVRAIRHGVRPDGTPLLFMPSTEFYCLSDEDLGAVIGYIKTVPPINNEISRSKLSPTGWMAMTFIKDITFLSADLIPHYAPRPLTSQAGVTTEYGEYLTYSCKVCHGLTMSGGKIPGFPREWNPAPNLTPGRGSIIPNWTEEYFIHVMRTGERYHGRQLNPDFMPWKSFRHMNDDELRAVWIYLQTLPPKDFGNR